MKKYLVVMVLILSSFYSLIAMYLPVEQEHQVDDGVPCEPSFMALFKGERRRFCIFIYSHEGAHHYLPGNDIITALAKDLYQDKPQAILSGVFQEMNYPFGPFITFKITVKIDLLVMLGNL